MSVGTGDFTMDRLVEVWLDDSSLDDESGTWVA
eukprot:CAMPEP_0113603098 /NCGR_PEP_ID=MMETSP0017_2-20120614/1100_1 /TAXON_ID=2856 /ORGANISM="Cylindrotheca closterium" /LENGTH=32 /DNA_ID=CAMNT_0000511473 /DNA_START=47 /DNA_END=145 /DNA_ORIENTATION=- /assembly_acc=CAM_ASM_000147